MGGGKDKEEGLKLQEEEVRVKEGVNLREAEVNQGALVKDKLEGVKVKGAEVKMQTNGVKGVAAGQVLPMWLPCLSV